MIRIFTADPDPTAHARRVHTRRNGDWPTAAVFDFDGLIADTGDCWHAAYRTVLARRGRRIGPAEEAALVGASVRGAARGLDVPEIELRAELRSTFAGATFEALPGVALLLGRLRDELRLAVATNGPHELVLGALRQLGLDGAFDAVVSAESLPREKPAPDVYLAACRALAVDPSQAIAFEDSAIGVTAARRAGLLVIQVPGDAAESTDADLGLARLDDPALFAFLGLAPPHEAVRDA
jgi:HAD superfamily hydrolase (TIGR01509 family)